MDGLCLFPLMTAIGPRDIKTADKTTKPHKPNLTSSYYFFLFVLFYIFSLFFRSAHRYARVCLAYWYMCPWITKWPKFHCTGCFHMTSRRPCWCPKPILWEMNSFLMQMIPFVPKNLRMNKWGTWYIINLQMRPKLGEECHWCSSLQIRV